MAHSHQLFHFRMGSESSDFVSALARLLAIPDSDEDESPPASPVPQGTPQERFPAFAASRPQLSNRRNLTLGFSTSPGCVEWVKSQTDNGRGLVSEKERRSRAKASQKGPGSARWNKHHGPQALSFDENSSASRHRASAQRPNGKQAGHALVPWSAPLSVHRAPPPASHPVPASLAKKSQVGPQLSWGLPAHGITASPPITDALVIPDSPVCSLSGPLASDAERAFALADTPPPPVHSRHVTIGMKVPA